MTDVGIGAQAWRMDVLTILHMYTCSTACKPFENRPQAYMRIHGNASTHIHTYIYIYVYTDLPYVDVRACLQLSPAIPVSIGLYLYLYLNLYLYLYLDSLYACT